MTIPLDRYLIKFGDFGGSWAPAEVAMRDYRLLWFTVSVLLVGVFVAVGYAMPFSYEVLQHGAGSVFSVVCQLGQQAVIYGLSLGVGLKIIIKMFGI